MGGCDDGVWVGKGFFCEGEVEVGGGVGDELDGVFGGWYGVWVGKLFYVRNNELKLGRYGFEDCRKWMKCFCCWNC